MNRIFFHQTNNEFCGLLGYCAVQSGNSKLIFWENQWVPPSMVKQSSFSFYFLDCWPLKMRPTGHPEMLVEKYHSTLRKLSVQKHHSTLCKLSVQKHHSTLRKLSVQKHHSTLRKLSVQKHHSTLCKMSVQKHHSTLCKMSVQKHHSTLCKLSVQKHHSTLCKLSVQKHHSTLCKIPEQCRSYLHHGGRLKSWRKITANNSPHQG